jgi:DNA-binding NarL/FixJ family response regulator
MHNAVSAQGTAMDQVVSRHSCPDEQLQKIISALKAGLIVVDRAGQILWIDDRARQLMNGGLQHAQFPILRGRAPAVDCFLSPLVLSANEEQQAVCVIQVTPEQGGQDFVGALQAAMADSSWLTRMLIERLQGWLQAGQPVSKSADLETLTAREREILALICEGRSDTEMSEILHLSHNTVRNHVASLYRKIGVNRRSAAIIWARERAITSKEALALNGHKRQRQPARAK